MKHPIMQVQQRRSLLDDDVFELVRSRKMFSALTAPSNNIKVCSQKPVGL